MNPGWYDVLSGTWEAVDPVMDDGSGPTYETRLWLCVRATNRQRAKILALRAWRRRAKLPWRNQNVYSHANRLRREVADAPFLHYSENPFLGLKVHRMTAEEMRETLEANK